MSSTKETIDIVVNEAVSPAITAKLKNVERQALQTALAQEKLQQSINRTATTEVQLATASAKLQSAESGSAKAATQAAIAQERLAQAESNTARAAAQAAAAQERLNQSRLRGAQAASKLASASSKTTTGGGMLSSLAKNTVVGMGGPSLSGGIAAPLMSGAGAALAGAYVAKEGIQFLVEQADAYNTITNRVQTMTGSLDSAAPAMRKILSIANATAAPFEATAEAVVRFDRVLKPMGKSQEQSMQFTENLQMMLWKYGKTAEESSSATLQLTQAMGKGKLDGDEFRSMMENVPELMTEIAKTLGVGKDKLFELSKTGQITSEVIYTAMQNVRGSLDSLPAPITTVDAAWTRLKNTSVEFFGDTALAQGWAAAIIGAMETVTKVLEKSEDSIDNIRYKVDLAKAKNEQDKKDAEERHKNSYAEREKRRQEARAAGALASSNYANNEVIDINREIELLQMKERDRAGERAIDSTRLKAKKEGIDLDYADAKLISDTAKKLFDLQEKQKRRGSGGVKEENRAAVLAKINAQLDHEYARMFAIESIRESQARFDQIEETLIGKKIRLTDQEALSIRAKIDANNDAKRVQTEYDRIVGDSLDQAVEFRSVFDASILALEQGRISLKEYNSEMERAQQKLDAWLDPQKEFNDNLKRQNELSTYSLRTQEILAKVSERDVELKKQGMSDADRAKQIELYTEQLLATRENNEARQAEGAILDATTEKVRLLNVQIEALVRLRGRLGEGATAQQTRSIMGDMLTPGKTWMQAALQDRKDAYAQIDAMEKAGVITVQEAENAKLAARLKTQNLVLDQAKGFFSNFEGMQRSNINEMAAIGKAAAIANATISTYQAATDAYKAMAGIPVVGPTLAAAAAAGAIASGMANVSAIAAQPTGFKDGGYTGNAGVNDVAGVVHGREYVFDAASTARIGRENLDAMRSGSPVGNSGGGQAQLNLTLVVVSSKEEAGSVASQAAGETMVIDVIGKNSRKISRMLGVKS